jgi:hypothetical protein
MNDITKTTLINIPCPACDGHQLQLETLQDGSEQWFCPQCCCSLAGRPKDRYDELLDKLVLSLA